MKKLNYLLLGLVAMGFAFTSCEGDDKDTPPTINLTGEAGYVSTDATVTVGETFKVGITAIPNTGSSSKLTKFTVTRTFNNVSETAVDSTLDKLTSFNANIIFTAQAEEGEERIVFEVTDKDGQVAEKVLIIKTEPSSNPLSTEKTFSLVYTSSTQSDGKNKNTEVGIEYKKNASSTTAQFATLSGKFVMINKDKYSSIISKEALASEYAAGTEVSDFTASADAKFEDIYFISKVGDMLFLVHQTSLKFAAGNNVAEFAYKQ